MNQRGISLLEVALSLAGFALVLGAVVAGMVADTRTHGAIVNRAGPELRARHVLDRMLTDLRTAGVRGEDRDQNGFFSPEEDLNGNGVLDADWSLPDGETRNFLSFNYRTDLRDQDGALIATGVYSPKTTYRLDGDAIVLERTSYLDDGGERTSRTVLAEGVRDLRIHRNDGVIQIAIAIETPLAGGEVSVDVIEGSVWLRN